MFSFTLSIYLHHSWHTVFTDSSLPLSLLCHCFTWLALEKNKTLLPSLHLTSLPFLWVTIIHSQIFCLSVLLSLWPLVQRSPSHLFTPQLYLIIFIKNLREEFIHTNLLNNYLNTNIIHLIIIVYASISDNFICYLHLFTAFLWRAFICNGF